MSLRVNKSTSQPDLEHSNYSDYSVREIGSFGPFHISFPHHILYTPSIPSLYFLLLFTENVQRGYRENRVKVALGCGVGKNIFRSIKYFSGGDVM